MGREVRLFRGYSFFHVSYVRIVIVKRLLPGRLASFQRPRYFSVASVRLWTWSLS